MLAVECWMPWIRKLFWWENSTWYDEPFWSRIWFFLDILNCIKNVQIHFSGSPRTFSHQNLIKNLVVSLVAALREQSLAIHPSCAMSNSVHILVRNYLVHWMWSAVAIRRQWFSSVSLPTLCQYRCADLPAQHTDNVFSSKHWIRDSCDLFKKCTRLPSFLPLYCQRLVHSGDLLIDQNHPTPIPW